MSISKISIKSQDLPELLIESLPSVVNEKHPFVLDLEKNRDLSIYDISVDDVAINKEDIFVLSIKIAHQGQLITLLNKSSFNKEEAIKQISPLKEIEANNDEVATSKLIKVIKILNDMNPIFMVYYPYDYYFVEFNAVKELASSLPILYADKVVKQIEKKEKPIKIEKKSENKQEETENKPKEPKSKPKWVNKQNLSAPFKLLAKEYVHFLFVLISEFLVFFALSIAIYNSYNGKTIYIFFYLSTITGVLLSGAIFSSILKRHNLKSLLFNESLVVGIIGMFVGLGAYIIYFNSIKEVPSYVPTKGKICLYSFLISIALLIASAYIPYIFKKLRDKKLKK